MKKSGGNAKIVLFLVLAILVSVCMGSLFVEGSYDVMSNGETWLVCDPNNNLEDIYDPVTYTGDEPPQYYGAPDYHFGSEFGRWQSGIRIPEYTKLPYAAAREISRLETQPSEEDGGGPTNRPGGEDETDIGIVPIDDFMGFELGEGGIMHVTDCDKDGDGYEASAGYADGDYTYPDDCLGDDCVGDVCYDNDPDRPCADGQFHLNENCPGELIQPSGSREFSDIELAMRFICYDEQGNGRYEECCGFNLQDCETRNDDNEPLGKRSGYVLKSIKEFDCAAMQNCVLKFYTTHLADNIDDCVELVEHHPAYEYNSYGLLIRDPYTDNIITDWSSFKQLEFYLYLATNFELTLRLGKYNSGPTDDEESYTFFYEKDYIIGSSVNGKTLGSWNHIILDFDAETELTADELTQVDLIQFYIDNEKACRAGGSIEVGGHTYRNAIAVDKIFLRPRGDMADYNNKLRYCSVSTGNIVTWITDLDDSTLDIGAQACEGTPSFGWTGNLCCGDDTVTDTKEYWADSDDGCWMGNPIRNDRRFGIVEYQERSLSNQNVNKKDICYQGGQEGCAFPLDHFVANSDIFLANLHPNNYNMYIFHGDGSEGPLDNTIDDNEYTVEEDEYPAIKFTDVPMNILYSDDENKFLGCQVPGYILSTLNQNNPDPLEGTLGTNLDSADDYCTVRGSYTCDYSDEWSNDELGAESAVDRDTQKPAVNLLWNGGFEADTNGWQGYGAYGNGRTTSEVVDDIDFGVDYVLSGRIRIDEDIEVEDEAVEGRASISLKWLNVDGAEVGGVGARIVAVSTHRPTDGFIYVEAHGRAPYDPENLVVSASVSVGFWDVANGKEVYFDNVQLTKSSNLITNSFFNDGELYEVPNGWSGDDGILFDSDDDVRGQIVKMQYASYSDGDLDNTDNLQQWQGINQIFNVIGGADYFASADAYLRRGNPGYAAIVVRWYVSEQWTPWQSVASFNEQGSWGTMSGVAHAPDGAVRARIAIWARFSDDSTNNALIDFDDVFVHRLIPDSPFVDSENGPKGCCPDTMCWDGNVGECVGDQYDDPDIGNRGYRDVELETAVMCKSGDWGVYYKRVDFSDNNAFGYCPAKSNCYHAGSCYITGQFIPTEDYVCEEDDEGNGAWTSRTKDVALMLYNSLPDGVDYTLACSPDSHLLSADDGLSELVKENDNNPESVCVMEYVTPDNKVVLTVGGVYYAEGSDNDVETAFAIGLVETQIFRNVDFIDNDYTAFEDNDICITHGNFQGFKRCVSPDDEYVGPAKRLYWNKLTHQFFFSNSTSFNLLSGISELDVETVFDQLSRSDYSNIDLDGFPGLVDDRKYYRYLFLRESGDHDFELLLDSPEPVHPEYDNEIWRYDKTNTFASLFYGGLETDDLSDTFSFYSGDAYCDEDASTVFAVHNRNRATLSDLFEGTTKRFIRKAECAYDSNYHVSSMPEEFYADYSDTEYVLHANGRRFNGYPTITSCCQLSQCWGGDYDPEAFGDYDGANLYDSDNGYACVESLPDPNVVESETIYWFNDDAGTGYACVKDVVEDEDDDPDNDIYLPARWQSIIVKAHWYNPEDTGDEPDPLGQYYGYCAELTDCWVQLSEDDGVCIDAGTFVGNGEDAKFGAVETEGEGVNRVITSVTPGDHYCLETTEDNGYSTWTTRTALIASQMRDIVENENAEKYTLFCDEAEQVLNSPPDDISDYNKFCSLEFVRDDETVTAFGTSLNPGADVDNDAEKEYFVEQTVLGEGALGFEDINCHNVIADNDRIEDSTFGECVGDDWHVYLDEDAFLLIISNDDLAFSSGFWRTVLDFLLDPFSFVQQIGQEHLTLPQDFDRLFLFEMFGTKIKGVVQDPVPDDDNEEGMDFVAIQYDLDSPHSIPYAIDDVYEEAIGHDYFGVPDDGTSYEVYTKEDNDAFGEGLSIWKYLTARLRVDTTCEAGGVCAVGYPCDGNDAICASNKCGLDRCCPDDGCADGQPCDEDSDCDNYCVDGFCCRSNDPDFCGQPR